MMVSCLEIRLCWFTINASEDGDGGGGADVVDMVGPVETELTMGSWDHGDLGAGGGMLVSGSVVAGVPSCPKFKCPDHREPCCCCCCFFCPSNPNSDDGGGIIMEGGQKGFFSGVRGC